MSYTASTSWIILFPYALRCSFRSLCILHLQSFFQDIDASIHIPVMDHVTFWTLPDTNTQIFYQRILVATAAAGLAARIHRWYSADLISIPDRLIFQHFEKADPGNTCYGSCQFMVTEHEFEVNARGSSFHLLVGKHAYGNYLCIPNWGIGTELSYLSDRFWNTEHLKSEYPELSCPDIISIVTALATLEKHIKL